MIALKSALILLLAASASCSEVNNEVEFRRGAPWWDQDSASAAATCHSSCTDYSVGVRTKVELCDDTDFCAGKGPRISVDEFAGRKCGQWIRSGIGAAAGITPVGRRFKHEPSKGSWISCAVFCRTESGAWYSPRAELRSEAFYPDGTWCHRDTGIDGTDYYCQKNLCLPQGADLTADEVQQRFRQLEEEQGESVLFWDHDQEEIDQ